MRMDTGQADKENTSYTTYNEYKVKVLFIYTYTLGMHNIDVYSISKICGDHNYILYGKRALKLKIFTVH